jgi:hypothetical protein
MGGVAYRASLGLLSESELRERVTRLAAIERGSASPGEREAAELIAADLTEAGARARLEEEPAHGTYWWPVGLLTAAAALAALWGRRAGAAVGLVAAAAVTDDITGGSQWFRRRFLPSGTTVNVVAELGPEDAERTIVFIAHHDAAHAGLVFHPAIPRFAARVAPKALEEAKSSPPTMWGAVAGPVLGAVGALLGLRAVRLMGAVLSGGYAAAMVDIGTRGVVPGANDNLTGVAVLQSLARAYAERPPDGARIVLLSTGSEESFMEGMQGFGRRHFASLPRERTNFVCIDTVGSPELLVVPAEGMLRLNPYPEEMVSLVNECAEETGVELHRGFLFRNATDGLIPLKAGYPTATLGSVNELNVPSNYHWPTDTAENVDYARVADAARLCEAIGRRLATASRSS